MERIHSRLLKLIAIKLTFTFALTVNASDERILPKYIEGDELKSLLSESEPIEIPESKSVSSRMDSTIESLSNSQEISIIVSDNGFLPPKVSVTQNIPVKLYLSSTSKKANCLMIDEFNIKRQVSGKEVREITFTPKKAGIFRYHCPIHGHEGSLIVKDAIEYSQASPSRAPANEIFEEQKPELKRLMNELDNYCGKTASGFQKGSNILMTDVGNGQIKLASLGNNIPNKTITKERFEAAIEDAAEDPFGFFAQSGIQYFSFWKFWQSEASNTPRAITVNTAVGIHLEKLDFYGFYGKGISQSPLDSWGVGFRVPFVDVIKTWGLAGSIVSGGKLFVAGELAFYTQTPEIPSATFLFTGTGLQAGSGIKWELGREGRIFLDTSVMAFRPTQGWYIAPLIALGASF